MHATTEQRGACAPFSLLQGDDASITLQGFTYGELLELCRAHQVKDAHAERLNAAIFRHRIHDMHAIEGLPKAFAAWLHAHQRNVSMQCVSQQVSSDGTQKFLFRLGDGQDIETVLIPTADRLTQCISTQVGCAMGCGFCLTASQGLTRNLRAAEMVEQIMLAERISGHTPRNLVLMGMGEPLHNYEEVARFIRIVTDPKGMSFSPRRVTLSTSGIVPAIYRMIEDQLPCNLAISLNGTTDVARESMMPVNRKYPIAVLMQAARDYIQAYDNKRILIEYVMLKGINDSLEDAHRLTALTQDLGCTINLLPFNAVSSSPYQSPDEQTVSAFRQTLIQANLVAVVRESRGKDISAACGQLKAEKG